LPDKAGVQINNICEVVVLVLFKFNICGIVLVMFKFKLKKMSHRAITCGQGMACGDTRYVRKVPLNSLAT